MLAPGDRWSLFTRLVQRAVASIDQRNPTSVLTSTPIKVPRTQLWVDAVNVDPEEFGDVLSRHLTAGPVVAVPPWERLNLDRPRPSGSTCPPYSSSYEPILADCSPAGPDSALAVLLPSSTFNSRRAEGWRAALAERLAHPVRDLRDERP
jgi:hypothetical protein